GTNAIHSHFFHTLKPLRHIILSIVRVTGIFNIYFLHGYASGRECVVCVVYRYAYYDHSPDDTEGSSVRDSVRDSKSDNDESYNHAEERRASAWSDSSSFHRTSNFGV